jgi:O-antigen/teichoic acid export membrane protein
MTELHGSASEAARGTTALLLQSAVSGSFRVVNIMILTRLLLQAEIGQIAVLSIIYGFMQFLGTLGLNHAAPLIVTENERTGQKGKVLSFLRKSVALILVSSGSLIVALFLVSPWILASGVLSSDLILFVMIVAPFSAMEAFLDSFLLARYKIRRLAIGRIAFDTTRAGGTILLVIIGLGVQGVVMGWLLGEFVAVLLFGFAAFKGIKAKSDSIPINPVLAFALPSLLFQTVDVTMQNTDRIILLYQTDLVTLAVFDVLLGMLFLMSFLSLSISTSLYPVLTSIRVDLEGQDNNKEELGRIVAILLRYVLIILLPISLIVVLNSQLIIEAAFGIPYSTFSNAPISLSILVIAYFFWGLTYTLHTVLRALGESRFFIYAGVAIVLFEIIACWYLTELFGLLGASLVRAFYVAMLFVTSIHRIRQHGLVNIVPQRLSIMRILSASLIVSLLIWLVQPHGLILMGSWALIALIIYLVVLFLIKEPSPTDFMLMYSIVPSKFHRLISRIEKFYSKSPSQETFQSSK